MKGPLFSKSLKGPKTCVPNPFTLDLCRLSPHLCADSAGRGALLGAEAVRQNSRLLLFQHGKV